MNTFRGSIVGSAVTLLLAAATPAPAVGPYQATGLKVGEVSDTTAMVWTRLTRHPQRNAADGPMVRFRYADNDQKKRGRIEGVVYPPGRTVDDLRDAAPGAAGQVRVLYKPADAAAWQQTAWQDVDPQRDFTRQFPLRDLQPDTRYLLRVESSAGDQRGQTIAGGFRTAPAAGQAARVVFTVSTGQAYGDRDRDDGYKIYPAMRQLDPSFFVHTGDIVYYDRLAKTIGLARYHWQRTYSLPTNVDFHNHVASYFIKDDHDAWVNDCWPTMKTDRMFQFTFQQGLAVFKEQVPMGELTYRTARWGRDLQVWLVEGRDYRSPNNQPDGPQKTIWGAEQKAWFKKTVAESDAAFRVLISPTPVVGPDRENKHDNHSNRDFQHEGNELRDFIAAQKNMVVVCGDRHWQYHSIDPRTGVREYSCGPASDQHAGGWRQDDFRRDYHRYLNVIGGFLSATVERQDGVPTLTFRYHGVDGEVFFEDRLTGQ